MVQYYHTNCSNFHAQDNKPHSVEYYEDLQHRHHKHWPMEGREFGAVCFLLNTTQTKFLCPQCNVGLCASPSWISQD